MRRCSLLRPRSATLSNCQLSTSASRRQGAGGGAEKNCCSCGRRGEQGWGCVARAGDVHQGRGQGWEGTRGWGWDRDQDRAGTGDRRRERAQGKTRDRHRTQGWRLGNEQGWGQETRTGEGEMGAEMAVLGAVGSGAGLGRGPARLRVAAEHVEPEDGGPGAGELVVVGDDDEGQCGGLWGEKASGWQTPAPPQPPPKSPALTSSSSSSPQ